MSEGRCGCYAVSVALELAIVVCLILILCVLPNLWVCYYTHASGDQIAEGKTRRYTPITVETNH